MRTSTLPQVRVEDEFRAAVESVLREGETMTSFIEDTMRRAVEHRRVEDEFHARGRRAWEECKRTGVSTPVDEAFDRIEAKMKVKIEARRSELLTRSK